MNQHILFRKKVLALAESLEDSVKEIVPNLPSKFYIFDALLKMSNVKFCSRCGGECILGGFRHVQNGVCFKCDGAGIFSGSTSPEALAKLQQFTSNNLNAVTKLVTAKL